MAHVLDVLWADPVIARCWERRRLWAHAYSWTRHLLHFELDVLMDAVLALGVIPPVTTSLNAFQRAATETAVEDLQWRVRQARPPATHRSSPPARSVAVSTAPPASSIARSSALPLSAPPPYDRLAIGRLYDRLTVTCDPDLALPSLRLTLYAEFLRKQQCKREAAAAAAVAAARTKPPSAISRFANASVRAVR
jgi:hypothetical protein